MSQHEEPLDLTDAVNELLAQSNRDLEALAADDIVALTSLVHDALDADRSFVIRTSGSMGVPKRVLLTAAAVRASAEATNQSLGGPGQWLLALQPQVVAGLQVLARSVVSKTAPVFVAPSFDPAAFTAAAQSMTEARRYVSMVPLQLARLIDAAETSESVADALRRFDAVLVGGQSLAHDLATRAETLGIRIVRTYGSTETSGGCVYNGLPIGDTRIRIEAGEVWISGSCLAAGYLDDSAATAERFLIDGEVTWFATHDAGVLENGVLRVTGRLDRVFTSGGVNVSLDAIEACVRAVPGWGSAVAVAVTDETWGMRAVLVSDAVAGASSFEDVQHVVREALGAPAVPVAAQQHPVPMLPSGKPDYQAVQKLF